MILSIESVRLESPVGGLRYVGVELTVTYGDEDDERTYGSITVTKPSSRAQ